MLGLPVLQDGTDPGAQLTAGEPAAEPPDWPCEGVGWLCAARGLRDLGLSTKGNVVAPINGDDDAPPHENIPELVQRQGKNAISSVENYGYFKSFEHY
jgi:hypothetical protein